jgi:toxin ParE1/3/4
MKPLLIHGEARVELDEAMTFYDQQMEGLGLDFELEVRAAATKIRENPFLGAPSKHTDHRYLVLARFPYVLYYLDLEEAVW